MEVGVGPQCAANTMALPDAKRRCLHHRPMVGEHGAAADKPHPAACPLSAEEERKLLEWLPKKRRAAFQHKGAHAKLFTGQDLKHVVQAALQEAQQVLSAEYDQVLAARLQEQYQHFARYHQDQVHRKLETQATSSSPDYIS